MHAFRQTTSLDHNFQNPEMEEEHKTNPFMSKSDLAVTYSSLDSYLYFATFLVISSHNKKFHLFHSISHCFITTWIFCNNSSISQVLFASIKQISNRLLKVIKCLIIKFQLAFSVFENRETFRTRHANTTLRAFYWIMLCFVVKR